MPKLKPYPKYKPSNIQWIGDIPEHWEVLKLRHILTNVRTERNRPDLPLLSVVREKGVILRDTTNKEENHNVIPEDLSNYKVVRKGQFAMNKMKAWQGSYGVSKHTGIVSPAYFVFDVNRISADYFHIAVRSKACVPFFAQASDGVRVDQWDLSQTRMKEIPIPIPPLDEQRAIARYLNRITSLIDTYTSNKRKLVDLLKEYRQALIHQTVTRGLDPNVKLKPTNIQWLGDIPEHWEVLPNRAVFQEVNERQHPEEEMLSVTIGQGVIRQQDLLEDSSKKDASRLDRSGYKLVLPGDIAYNKMRAWQGAIGMSQYRGIVSPAYIVQRPRSIANPTYLHNLLRTPLFQKEAERWSYGIASDMWSLRPEHFKVIYIPLPPLSEQRAIADFLDRKTDKIDYAIDLAQREIELLHEYRTRLIADVVTGQLDVREAATDLPEHAPDTTDNIK